MEALDSHDSEDLLGVGREGDTLLDVVHVEDFVLLFLRLDGVLDEALPLYLFAFEGLLPNVHDALVFLVHVEFVVHGLHGFLVEGAEILAEESLLLGHHAGDALVHAKEGCEEGQVLLHLDEFKHI